MGNPPFIGGKDIRAEQGDAYVEALWKAHPDMNDSADFVMYWWDRCADLLTRKGSKLRRFGLVTTNSITQVFQRRVMARWMAAKRPLSLIFAVDDHPWTRATKDAAAVRIAMTACESGSHEGKLLTVKREARLDSDQPEIETSEQVGVINADLTVGVDVTRAKALMANDLICSPGVKLHGAGFIVSRAEAEHLGLGRRVGLEAHIRPYLNGRDMMARSRGKMVIDLFGLPGEQVQDAYPEAYQHLAQTVRKDRAAQVERSNTRDAQEYLDRWWTFGKPRQELRAALGGLRRYTATVETAKHRVFQFLDASILPDNMLIAIATDDAAVLAVLSSSTHVGYAVRAGGWLGMGNDPRYSKSRCFDPFPFPAWTEAQRAALAAAGERLDAFRKARLAETDLTLTRLYNALEAHRALQATGKPMSDQAMTPQERADFDAGSVLILDELHRDIDRLTLDAYGWSDLNEPFPLEGGRVGMGVEDEATRAVSAASVGAAAPSAATPNPGPSPLQGEGGENARRHETLLARLVALNAERAAEEAKGQVRWLRPDYQKPRFAGRQTAGPEQVRDLIGDLPAAATARPAFPTDRTGQHLAVLSRLHAAPAPLSPADIAAGFKGRNVAPRVDGALRALARLGYAQPTPDGRAYQARRAA